MSRTIFTDELISTFKEKIKDKYPDISEPQIEKICRAEFQMLKESMQDNSLEEVRLQYLFTVKVSPQKVIKQLTYMQVYKDRIRPKKYQHYLIMLLDYINKEKIKFKKYENRITEITGFTPREIRKRKYTDNGHSSTT
jgi:hypothetical protein